jgi:YHS domain-containing protein
MIRFNSLAMFSVCCVMTASSAFAQFNSLAAPRPVGNCPGGICNYQTQGSAYRPAGLFSAFMRPQQGYASAWSPGVPASGMRQPSGYGCANGQCPNPQWSGSSSLAAPNSGYYQQSGAYGQPGSYRQPSGYGNPGRNEWTPSAYRPQASLRDSGSAIPRGMEGIAQLPVNEQYAALNQRTCPVSRQLLGSTGRPIRVAFQGGSVYVCCQSCADAFRRNPTAYLQQNRLNGASYGY